MCLAGGCGACACARRVLLVCMTYVDLLVDTKEACDLTAGGRERDTLGLDSPLFNERLASGRGM